MRRASVTFSTLSILSNIFWRLRACRMCRSLTTIEAHNSKRLMAASILAISFCWAVYNCCWRKRRSARSLA